MADVESHQRPIRVRSEKEAPEIPTAVSVQRQERTVSTGPAENGRFP